MPRGRRHSFNIRPVNSFKRIIDTSGSLGAGAVSTTTLAGASTSTTAVDPTGTSAVPTGAHLSAIYYSVFIFTDATEAGDPTVDLFYWKNPGGELTAPTAGATDASNNKRHIIHEEKGLAGNRTTGTPMVIKGVLRIPSHYRRFGIGDQLELRIKSVVAGFFCAKHIFKVYY